jgi:NTE family protein
LKTFSLPKNTRNNQFLIAPQYKSFEPKIGIALSGGGARGIAHIGVLKVLIENNIPIDFIVGTSMGNIVGGLYASGYTVDEIWDLAKAINWNEIIQDQPSRLSLFLSQKEVRNRHLVNIRIKNFKPYIPPAISPGQKLYNQLSDLILGAPYQAIATYDDLKIPFRAVATDLVSGKKIVFKDGDLAQVMLASSAIPLLFSPVKIDSMLLMDGGILENIPVEELQKSELDLIIVVDTTSPLRSKDEILLPWQLADQVTTIMQENQKSASRKIADIVIKPKLYNRTNTNFDSLTNAYDAGISAAYEKLPEIVKKVSAFRNEYLSTSLNKWTISKVELDNESQVQNFSKLPELTQKVWTDNEINLVLEKLYRSGYFYSLDAVLLEKSDSFPILRINNSVYPVIEKLTISHNNFLSDSLLLANIETSEEQHFNVFVWQQDRENILKLYRKNNFSKARIKSEYLDLVTGLLEIEIDEGKIKSLELVGNEKTKTSVVMREYPIKPGDHFLKNLAQQGSSNIFSLDFFDRVQPEYFWKDDKLNIKIHVVEKPTKLLRFSYNFNRDDRLNTQFQWVDNNLFGYGNRLIISSILGKRHYSGRVRLQSDRLLKTYLAPTIDLYHFKRKHYVFKDGDIAGEFRERRSGFFSSIGHQIERVGQVSVQFRLEQIGLNSVFGSGYPITKINKTSIRLQSIVDSRDKLPFPNHGRFHNFYYEMSNEFKGNDIQFFKIYSSLESFYTFFKRWTFHPKLVWATADLTTPFQDMYILGGENSFFGYRTDEIRGRRLFQTNIEIRYFLPGKLPFDTYFSLRYDYGKMWENSLDVINLKDFIQGYGGSISINSLLGTFSVSYGENNEGRKEYYFNLGFNF